MKPRRILQASAAILFASLCVYSALNFRSYPPPASEKTWLGPLIKLSYSLPGIAYFIFIVGNWIRGKSYV